MKSPDEQSIAGLRKNENGGRLTVPIFVAVAGIVVCVASRNGDAAERSAVPTRTPAAATAEHPTGPTETSGAAAPASAAPVTEGPVYPFPPNPEEQKRIDRLTQALTDSEARSRAAEATAEHELAEERAQREALKLRLDALESSLTATAQRTESAPPSRPRAGD